MINIKEVSMLLRKCRGALNREIKIMEREAKSSKTKKIKSNLLKKGDVKQAEELAGQAAKLAEEQIKILEEYRTQFKSGVRKDVRPFINNIKRGIGDEVAVLKNILSTTISRQNALLAKLKEFDNYYGSLQKYDADTMNLVVSAEGQLASGQNPVGLLAFVSQKIGIDSAVAERAGNLFIQINKELEGFVEIVTENIKRLGELKVKINTLDGDVDKLNDTVVNLVKGVNETLKGPEERAKLIKENRKYKKLMNLDAYQNRLNKIEDNLEKEEQKIGLEILQALQGVAEKIRKTGTVFESKIRIVLKNYSEVLGKLQEIGETVKKRMDEWGQNMRAQMGVQTAQLAQAMGRSGRMELRKAGVSRRKYNRVSNMMSSGSRGRLRRAQKKL